MFLVLLCCYDTVVECGCWLQVVCVFAHFWVLWTALLPERPSPGTSLPRTAQNFALFSPCPASSFALDLSLRGVFLWNCCSGLRPWTAQIVRLYFSGVVLCEPWRKRAQQLFDLGPFLCFGNSMFGARKGSTPTRAKRTKKNGKWGLVREGLDFCPRSEKVAAKVGQSQV